MSERQTLAFLEAPRAILNMVELSVSPWLLMAPSGNSRGVFVLPGFGASDDSTLPLRTYLSILGYKTAGWGLGRNLASETRAISRLHENFSRFAGDHQEPVSIVGWSLGGIYGRELARAFPNQIDRVICLGSPIGPNAAPLPVHCTSIFSHTDAVVPASLSTLPETALTTNIAVRSSHLGLGVNPRVLHSIARELGFAPVAGPIAAS